MRALIVALLTAVILALSASPVRACDPYWDWWCDWYDPYWDPPAYEVAWWDEPAYVVEPVIEAPAWSDPVVWVAPEVDALYAWAEPEPVVAPAPAVIPAPDPMAEAAALGLHAVTEVFAGHVVTTAGDLTTYTSASAALDAGTAARVVATVSTGESTAYDDLVLGGRTTLTDGRAVAGQIYENYVWNGSEWVVNAYVFFQDDAELARAAQATPTPPPASVAPIVEAPVAAPVASPQQNVPAAPGASPRPAAPTPAPAATPESGPPPSNEVARPSSVAAGLALAPQADALGRIEVLRGRRVALWVRATVDGAPARVIRWELRGGEVTVLGPVAGSGDEPLVGSWRDVGRPGTSFVLTVRATVEVAGEGSREVDATIEVIVRSAAVVE